MNILIVGAGSIGLYLGAKMLRSGMKVHLLGGNKLKHAGDKITINNEIFDLPSSLHWHEIDEHTEKKYDLVVFATKLPALTEAITTSLQKKISGANYLFVQNGMIGEDHLGPLRGHAGVVTSFLHTGFRLHEQTLHVSKEDFPWQLRPGKQSSTVVQILQQANINAQEGEHFIRDVLEKFIVNISANALSALESKNVAELLQDQGTKQFIEGTFREAYQILRYDYPQELEDFDALFSKVLRYLEHIGTHYPSMYQDVKSNRQTEIEYLNGYIVRKGLERGLPTPYNVQLWKNFKQGKCALLHSPICLLCKHPHDDCHKRECNQ